MKHLRMSEDELRAYQQRQRGATRARPCATELDAAPGGKNATCPSAAQSAPRHSLLEQRFEQQLRDAGFLPRADDDAPMRYVREYYPIASRNFRLDFAWPEVKVGVEIQGMAHRIKGKFRADIEKRALCLLADWRVLEVGSAEVRDGTAIQWLRELLAR